MKKILASAGILIAVACYFAILYLLVPFTIVTGITILFTVLFLLLCLVGFLVFLEEPCVEQYFYSLPGAYVALTGLGIQAVVGVVLCIVQPFIVPALLIELVLFGVCGSIECYVLYAGVRARDINKKVERETGVMRRLRAQADTIWKTAPDYEWKRKAKEVAELVNYANPIRADEFAQEFEDELSAELDALETAMRKNDTASFNASRTRIRNMLSR